MDRLNKRITVFGVMFFLFFLLISAVVFKPRGGAVFMEQRCNTCHRFQGAGGMAGPDLTDVLRRRGTIWTMRQIRDPKTHNPDSRMPAYNHLDYCETYAIISYLKS